MPKLRRTRERDDSEEREIKRIIDIPEQECDTCGETLDRCVCPADDADDPEEDVDEDDEIL